MKQYLRIFIILSTVVLLSGNLILDVHGTDTKTSQTVGKSSITSIEEQVRAFAKSINQTNADDTAAWALAKYGIVGGGKTLNIGKTHSLTATLWNSELALKTIIQSCKVSIDVMQQQNLSAVFGDAGCRWENSRNIYYEPALYKKMVNVKKGEGLCYPSNYVDFKGSLNSYDKSLIWMVGTCGVNSYVTRATATDDTITYNVKIFMIDQFDFDTNKGSVPREIASLLGSILFREFEWISTAELKLVVPNNCDHSGTVTDKITKPTCTSKGYTTRTCSHCGYTFKTDYTNTLPHNYKTTVVPPTCTTEGYSVFTCTCGDSYKGSIVPVPGHQKEIILSIQPTCTNDGLSEGIRCFVCNEVIIAQQIIPTRGHEYSEWTVSVEPDCTNIGTEVRDCKECGLIQSRDVSNLGHVLEYHDAQSHTCTEIGWDTYETCTRCDYTTYVEIPANGHSYSSLVTAPTCTERGFTTYTCHCSDSYVEDYVYATGHTEVIDAAVGATCTTTGLTEGKHCSVCNETLTAQQTTEALGHDFSPEWTIDVEPTTTTLGQKSRHCSRCDEVTDIIEIAKLVEIIDTSKMFNDVTTSSWAKEGIDYVVSYGYMNGTGNGSMFSPSGTMSRSMIVTVLYRIAGQPSHSGNDPFNDIDTGWYYDAVLWTYENGIVTGTSKTTFAPDGAVTREQMATFLYRFAKHMDYDISKTNDISTFPDASKVGSWAYDALAWANAEGLITGAKGSDGVTRLDPQGNATREQVATILMRFCKAFAE